MKATILGIIAAFAIISGQPAQAEQRFVFEPIICHEFTVSPTHCAGDGNKILWFRYKLAQLHGCNHTSYFPGGASKWTGQGGFNGSNGCLLDPAQWDWVGDSVTMTIIATSYNGCFHHWYQITGGYLQVASSSIWFDPDYFPNPIEDYDIDFMFMTPTGAVGGQCGGIIN